MARREATFRTDKHFKSLDLSNNSSVLSIESPPILELKLLPSHLKYVYLSDNDMFPIIISSSLNAKQEKRLVDVLGRYKMAIGWTTTNIKRINPSIRMH